MNTKKIKKWMIDAGITGAHVARKTGVSRQYVSMIIGGSRNSKAVEEALRELGCPEKYLRKRAS